MYDDSSVAVFFKGTVEALENDTGITAAKPGPKPSRKI